MKAFLVANPKGGSGKSTLSTNLAGYFAKEWVHSSAPALVRRSVGIAGPQWRHGVTRSTSERGNVRGSFRHEGKPLHEFYGDQSTSAAL